MARRKMQPKRQPKRSMSYPVKPGANGPGDNAAAAAPPKQPKRRR